MIKILIPEPKGKKKTSVRGFWYDKTTNKTYYDYLNIKRGYYWELEFYQKHYKQEAIFYINKKIGCIYNNGKIELLPHRIYKEVLRQNLKKAIKEALSTFNGCTIYLKGNKYYIEIFTTI